VKSANDNPKDLVRHCLARGLSELADPLAGIEEFVPPDGGPAFFAGPLFGVGWAKKSHGFLFRVPAGLPTVLRLVVAF
jgi:hypothetical protein